MLPESISSKPFMNLIETALQMTNLSNCFSRFKLEIKLGIIDMQTHERE